MPFSSRIGIGPCAVGAEVQITSNAALAFQLAKDHGGWAPPMADCLGRCGVVVDVVNSQGDVRVNCGDFGSYVWNSASIVGQGGAPAEGASARGDDVEAGRSSSTGASDAGLSVLALDLHPRRLFATRSAQGTWCSVCRRGLGSEAPGVEAEVTPMDLATSAGSATAEFLGLFPRQESVAVGAVASGPMSFVCRDGAFRLCDTCAAPYLDAGDRERVARGSSGAAPAPLDCPGHHGLSYVASTGVTGIAVSFDNASCDVCGKEGLKASTGDALPRACRSCNWVACADCAESAPLGARAPSLYVGASCRVDRRGKPARAVIVDVRGEGASSEVLVHYPGFGADAKDEWFETSSSKMVPVNPPAASARAHPAHRCSLALAVLPGGVERWPRCAAEEKMAGGCRRFSSADPKPPSDAGLYCERCDVFFCPWCCSDEVLDGANSVEGICAANCADVAALRDPARCGDAAQRVLRQCSRSVAARVGMLRAGAVRAAGEALATLASDAVTYAIAEDAAAVCLAKRRVLALFLHLAEWLFLQPAPPSVGDVVLCERSLDEWLLGTVVECQSDDDGGPSFTVVIGVQPSPVERHSSKKLENLRTRSWVRSAGSYGNLDMQPSLNGSNRGRQGVPPPLMLTRDFLMKKAIPADNTAQARQYLVDGAEPGLTSETGDGSLVLAVEHGCMPRMIELLLEWGCPVAAGATLGDPLRLAARYGQSENIELLLDACADPSALFDADIPPAAAKRISSLAAFLGVGSAGPSAVADAVIHFSIERETLAREALQPLVRLAARPLEEVLDAEEATDARLLAILDALLGVVGAEVASQPALMADLFELLQRLMVTYSPTAARGGLLLVKRLIGTGPQARLELSRCGALRFIERAAAGGVDRQLDEAIHALAREVGRELAIATGLATETLAFELPFIAERDRVLGNLTALAAATKDSASAGDRRLATATAAVKELEELLRRPGGATAFELEAFGVPEALATLLDAGALSLAELGDGYLAPALVCACLRIVETSEVLPVEPLPAYLSRAPGLRVLSEPLLLGVELASGSAESSSALQRRWFQVEPLLSVRELERAILLTSAVLDHDFLAWCVSLVGHEVAPRASRRIVLPGSGGSCGAYNGATGGRVVDFRLLTPLRLPAHTLRRADGQEVDLVASVHGLAAVEPCPPPLGLRLRVALLRLEAALEPDQVAPVLTAVRAALMAGHALVSTSPWAAGVEDPVVVPAACDEVLTELGFRACSDHYGEHQLWHLVDDTAGGGSRELHFEMLQVASQRPARGAPGNLDEEGGVTAGVEPDAALVAEIAGIFSENAARRACIAVNNQSSEAAMEWCCQHQGDHDFNDPLPTKGGYTADPRAPVWSVFIVLPPGVPFDLVWPMLEDPVKGALTSVANAWTAMGWAGGEAEMRETLRAHVAVAGEGPIARGLVRSKADRVASRLRSACECRVDADPEGAAHAPSGGRAPAGAAASRALSVGSRVRLVLEAEQLGFVAAASEVGIDVVTDDGRILQALPPDQVRLAPRMPPLAPVSMMAPGVRAVGVAGASGNAVPPQDVSLAPSSMAEPLQSLMAVPLQRHFEAMDRAAQESDVVRRLQPSDLLRGKCDAIEVVENPGMSPTTKRNKELQPVPSCRVSFSVAPPSQVGVASDSVHLLRGERFKIRPIGARGFASASWLTAGLPGLAAGAGHWYYEVELTTFKNPQVGWASTAFRFQVGSYTDDGVGDDTASWGADCERRCLWHKGMTGEWRTCSPGQTMCCAVSIDDQGYAQFWFSIDGAWEPKPALSGPLGANRLYPAVSGELEANFRCFPQEMLFSAPGPHFLPIGEVVSTDFAPRELLLPPDWTVLRGLSRLVPEGLPEDALPLPLRAKVYALQSEAPAAAQHHEEFVIGAAVADDPESPEAFTALAPPLALRRLDLDLGFPLRMSDEEWERALIASRLTSPAARAALRLLRELCPETAGKKATAATAVSAVSEVVVSPTAAVPESVAPLLEGRVVEFASRSSRRLGAKLGRHLRHPLACCAGAFPRWCNEFPVLAPWLFPLEAREALLRCSAFGLTFAIRWLQDRAVEERFAERQRSAEGRLAQAKLIGDAALLNGAYETLFELQGQIARDPEAWVGSLKSELLRMERDGILPQAAGAMELTKSSPCALEVQFEGESGFGRAVTQGFYTLVAHELQRRATNREVPMWVEDEPSLNEDFLRPRRGLLTRPLPADDPRLPEVEARFCMLGRLMAKAVREGFVVPLPLTSIFFKLLLGCPPEPLTMLPRPGDGISGEFVGVCAKMVADATTWASAVGDGSPEVIIARLEELAADPEWSRKYMRPPDEELDSVSPEPFETYASLASFVETGLSGAPLCPDGDNRSLDVRSVPEFVQLATSFWFDTGVKHQFCALRRGLYDVLGEGAVTLWAFSPSELRSLFCGEDEVVWTEKELHEHIHCGGGYTSESEPIRWLREELLAMAQPFRAKFLDFVTSCPRLPPGGLKELQIGVHPDPAGVAGLPRSRACAHRLFLPRYASREELARQLHEAIWSSGGHHELQLPP